MGKLLYLAAIVFAVFAKAYADIQVNCGPNSIDVRWRIPPDMFPYVARFFLGNCLFSNFEVLANGEGEIAFNYSYGDCKFKRLMTGKRVSFQNELAFRPQPKSKPAAFKQTIQCVFKRPKGWIPPILNPGTSNIEGRGGLSFHMLLLDPTLSHVADTNIIPLGAYIPIWAMVEQMNHQPLMLLMEWCVAAKTPKLEADSPVYGIIGNKGCLYDSMNQTSKFQPRYHPSALTLLLKSSRFGLGEEVYIHCKLSAWDPSRLDATKKTCHYSRTTWQWELLDDPLQSDVCSCCQSTCRSRPRREEESQAVSQRAVLGPVVIVDVSDSAGSGSKETQALGEEAS